MVETESITWGPKGRPIYGMDNSRGRLEWVKSGTRSRVYDAPYEIWEMWPTPVKLSSTTIPKIHETITTRLREEVFRRAKQKRTKWVTDDLIQADLTCIYGQASKTKGTIIDSPSEARKAYRAGVNPATLHTDRWTIGGLEDLGTNIFEILNKFLDRPGSPDPWFITIKFTIRFEEEDTDRLYKGRDSIKKRYDSAFGGYVDY